MSIVSGRAYKADSYNQYIHTLVYYGAGPREPAFVVAASGELVVRQAHSETHHALLRSQLWCTTCAEGKRQKEAHRWWWWACRWA